MTLRKGSKGENVKKLQTKLGLVSDGNFGPITEGKLKEWQKKNGLSEDGIASLSILRLLGVVPDKSPAKKVIKEDVVIPKSSGIDLSKLKGHIPDVVISQIPMVIEKFQINTPLRLAHFLAQCSHESGNFRAVHENMNYSVEGLKKIFPKYFPGNLAESYARNPEKIASKVYGGRMGNGDESTKEGFLFRGRGYIQLTGKSNYAAFGKAIGEDTVKNPDLVATHYPLASAAWFFSKNGLNVISDRGSDELTVTAVTRRVNGGVIGLKDRLKHFNQYHKLLS